MFGKGKGAERSNHDNQRGFTLVEMAIVLAIIGLIVGGVMKGQELVQNARLKAQVAQIDAIKAAVATFQDKYNFLPGDFAGNTVFGTTSATDGKEIGVVSATAGGLVDTSAWDSAGELAFLQMQAAGLLSGVTASSSTTASTPATLANAKAGWTQGKITGTWLVLQTFNSTWWPTSTGVRIQSVAPGTAPTAATATTLTPADAATLDTKYDDGSPISGSVLAPSYATSCAQNSVYTLATTSKACDLVWVVN